MGPGPGRAVCADANELFGIAELLHELRVFGVHWLCYGRAGDVRTTGKTIPPAVLWETVWRAALLRWVMVING